MQAIILAAGMGKRLKTLTKNNTKCMVEVNGVSLIDRLLGQIDRQNFSRVVIVTGYKGKALVDHINSINVKTPVVFIDNPVYDKTNNIYSLSLATDYLAQEDTVLFESDLIFEDSILEDLINDPRKTLALVDKYESWMDGTCLKLDEEDNITEFVPGSKFQFSESDDYYKTVNIYKFSKHFSVTHYIPFLDAYTKALGNNEYYEQVLRVITMLDSPEIKAKRIPHDSRWYEIDDKQDLDIASVLFMDDTEDKLKMMEGRYGGYWRFPNLLDFCYLVNPYYPPTKMKEEIKDSFDTLLTQYPSGQRVNSLLASRDMGVEEDNIVVGNGAAELIKAFMDNTEGKVGCIKPTFEEYPNRYDKNNVEYFIPDNDDYTYNASDVIGFLKNSDVKTMILIDPDNPTGNFINNNGLEEIVKYTADNKIRLVVDESFADFADEYSTLLDQDFLISNPHVIVVKSISKSYGVPGLRLGVLASGDTELIKFLKKEIAIWNINSFAEFYMQIATKYEKDYKKALTKIRNERKRFYDELIKIPGIHVVPSQANYFLVRLKGDMTARELTKKLLVEHNLLIKDLSKKLGRTDYVRIAIRNKTDNDKLLNALNYYYK